MGLLGGLIARHETVATPERNPERFVRGTPKPPTLPTAAWINKPNAEGGDSLNTDT